MNKVDDKGLKQGIWVDIEVESIDYYGEGFYYRNKYDYTVVNYVDGVRQGLYKKFTTGYDKVEESIVLSWFHDDDATPYEIGYFKDNLLEGLRKVYFNDTQIVHFQCYYKKGKKHGVFKSYNSSSAKHFKGTIIEELSYYENDEKKGYSYFDNSHIGGAFKDLFNKSKVEIFYL